MASVHSSCESLSRRAILAAMPAGALAGLATRTALAQPAAADPVSFYLGQVLALATLQAEAIGRLRPLLATSDTQDSSWQSGANAEAGVIGAVAAVLGAMAPPPELAASVDELVLASSAYQRAADAARGAADGDAAAIAAAAAGLAEGATHILLWLDALTAETGNDWGDGLRSLTLGVAPVPVAEIALQSPAAPSAEATVDPGDGVVSEGEPDPAADLNPGQGQGQNRQTRQSRQDRPNRQNRDDDA